MRLGSSEDRWQLSGVAFAFVVVATVLALAALPNWQIELVISIVGVLIIGWATGRSLSASVSGLLCAVTVVLLRTNPSELPLGYRLVGLLATLVCAIPLLLRSRRDSSFPLLGIFCAIQGLYIYVGALIANPSQPNQALYSVRIRELGLIGSLAYVFVVVMVGLLAHRTRPVFTSVRRWTSRTPDLSSKTFSRSVLLYIVGLATLRLLPAGLASDLGAIPQVIGLARIVGFSLMLLLWLRGDLTPTKKVLVLLAAVIDTVSGTNAQFALYSASGIVISGLILLLVSRPRLVAWLLLPLIPISLLFNVAKTEGRANATKPSNPIDATYVLASDALNTALHPVPGALTTSAERFATSDLLGYIEFHVPSDYPYWNKQTYTELPLVLVPRIIAPFKPKFTLANEFGREYGILNPNDFGTSENTPLQVEAWANFGPEGLIGIAIIIGALLGLGEGMIDRRRMDGMVIGTLIAYLLSSGIESGASAFALVIPAAIIYLPVTRWAIGAGEIAPVDDSDRNSPPSAPATNPRASGDRIPANSHPPRSHLG
jgi:hypothetical protein